EWWRNRMVVAEPPGLNSRAGLSIRAPTSRGRRWGPPGTAAGSTGARGRGRTARASGRRQRGARKCGTRGIPCHNNGGTLLKERKGCDMATNTIEERLTALEADVARLKQERFGPEAG